MVESDARQTIVALGGESASRARSTDLLIETATGRPGARRGAGRRRGTRSRPRRAGLGHSARDTFEMLHGAACTSRPSRSRSASASSIRSPDRPRPLRPHAGHPLLGAADYKLVHHASNGRSVYSFCMCPGGTVVAATSEPAASSPTA
jgi:uncharacterized FAD-dependent dehydrogenase